MARFYKAISRPARFGRPGEYARSFTFTLQADNYREAIRDAKGRFQQDSRGLDFDYLVPLGTDAPESLGELRII
jgi:hypothetical protein